MNNPRKPRGFFLFFQAHPLIASLLSFVRFKHSWQTFPFVSCPRWSHSCCPSDVVKGMSANKDPNYSRSHNCNFFWTLASSTLELFPAGVIKACPQTFSLSSSKEKKLQREVFWRALKEGALLAEFKKAQAAWPGLARPGPASRALPSLKNAALLQKAAALQRERRLGQLWLRGSTKTNDGAAPRRSRVSSSGPLGGN